jgi:hypothetical protein
MKRIFSLTLAATLALGTVSALAQPYQPYAPPYDHGGPPGPDGSWHQWHRGDRFHGDRHVIDWRYHHLHRPPPGYEWVDNGGEFVLIAIGSGVIADIFLNR